MAYNELLADRVRELLVNEKQVEEKKMFVGISFMVNGKMCVGVREDELMARISPEDYIKVVEQPGCRPMIHNGKEMKGFVFIAPQAIASDAGLEHWVKLALSFNDRAKAAPKKKKAVKAGAAQSK
jgi:TfoX/Sxy family transcriptional regulator of competence genes